MDNVEVYALMFKTECIYIGRSYDGANNAILRHFQHVQSKCESYRKFNPKLFDFIKDNGDLDLYSINSFGFFDKKKAIKEQRKLIEKHGTYSKCNSLVKSITKDLKQKSKDTEKKRIIRIDSRCSRIKCDQTGERFTSIVLCADKYCVNPLEIVRNMKTHNRNRRTAPDSIKGLSFSYIG